MAGKRKEPAKKTEARLEYDTDTGSFWLVKGKDKTDVGRSRRYAEKLLAEANQ